MTYNELVLAMSDVRFPGYTFEVHLSGRGEQYLRATFCVETFTHHTRRWLLSPAMTKSEVVQTALKCVLAAVEHEAREAFTYRGRAIFGPHFDVDVLWDAAAAPLAQRTPA